MKFKELKKYDSYETNPIQEFELEELIYCTGNNNVKINGYSIVIGSGEIELGECAQVILLGFDLKDIDFGNSSYSSNDVRYLGDFICLCDDFETEEEIKDEISQAKYLSESFIRRYSNKLNFDVLWIYQNLSTKFIEDFIDKVNWDDVSDFQRLNIKFVEKYKELLNWEKISTYHPLSETFIEKYKDYVDWRGVSGHQKLSEDFIEKYRFYIDWENLSENNYIEFSEEFKEKYKDKIDWYWYGYKL